MIKFVVADMDGTLLNSKKEFSPSLFPLIRTLKKMGVRFGVASGRQYYNLLEEFKEFDEDILYIAENGAIIFDHGENIYVNGIDQEKLVAPVLATRKMGNAHAVLCGAKCAYYESDNPDLIYNVEMYYARNQRVPDVLEAAKQDSICKIAVFNEVDAESTILSGLQAFDGDLLVSLSSKNWVDIMNPGINKGRAIQFIQQLYAIEPSECMAFGDYLNDYEMMQVCDYSYAMANAHPDLKRISNFMAKSNDEDGVVDAVVRHFGLELELQALLRTLQISKRSRQQR